MVEGDRSSDRAIDLIESPAAIPREISSRSDNDNTRLDRVRSGGRMPPVLDRMPAMEP